MGKHTRCLNCGLEYDPVTEVTCPACTSGMAHSAVGSSKLDPGAAGRARAAVQFAENELFLERRRQSEQRAARRSALRGASLKVAFGVPVILFGVVMGPQLRMTPVYGPILALAPLLIGAGIILTGVGDWAKARSRGD